jgi:hypothetical protein
MAYSAFWGGAATFVEAEGTASPTAIAADGRFKAYNHDDNNPNDGHDGANTVGKPHKPSSAKNDGPGSAKGGKTREWLLWRVTYRFNILISQGRWNADGPYVLSNCARMGTVALANAHAAGYGSVRWEDAFSAFYAVRDKPITPAGFSVKDAWCV